MCETNKEKAGEIEKDRGKWWKIVEERRGELRERGERRQESKNGGQTKEVRDVGEKTIK